MPSKTPKSEFVPGQEVRTRYGNIETVLFQAEDGLRVFTEEAGPNSWYHPGNLTPLWNDTLKKSARQESN
jgi:hypothetical protein